jgi:hypothetical protein
VPGELSASGSRLWEGGLALSARKALLLCIALVITPLTVTTCIATNVPIPTPMLPPSSPQGVAYCGGQGSDVEQLGAWSGNCTQDAVPGDVQTVLLLAHCEPDRRFSWTEAGIASWALQHPGTTYLLFNEPDLCPDTDCLTPVEGAYLARFLIEFISGYDPLARFVCCGVSQVNSLEWEEDFLDAYEAAFGILPPLDGWHTHFYPAYQAQGQPAQYYAARTQDYLLNYRSWVDDHGGGELWLTEFAIFHNDNLAAEYMHLILPWLQNRVDRYQWWCSDLCWYWPDCQGSLLYPDGGLTPLGEVYSLYR